MKKLVYVFLILSMIIDGCHSHETGGIHYFRSYDRIHHHGLAPLDTAHLRFPYVAVRDSGLCTVVNIEVDQQNHWREVYQHADSCLSSVTLINDHGDSLYRYRYIRDDTMISYLYHGILMTDADAYHYLISISTETEHSNTEYHFYPFLSMRAPSAQNTITAKDSALIDRMTINEFREEKDVLKVHSLVYDYAEGSSNKEQFRLYDLRRYPSFYRDYMGRDMLVR